MIFQSIDYLFFLVSVFVLYWAVALVLQRAGGRLAVRVQNILLLVVSYYFYGYIHPWYVALIAATTIIDFTNALLIQHFPAHKKKFLTLSLLSNFSILAAFKYFGFFVGSISALLGSVGWEVSPIAYRVLLPVGISFYTFQSASYVIDVYRGQIAARRNLIDYAVFVAFFPQLVAGPIERSANLLRRVESPRTFDWTNTRDALLLILWGLFKKLVIADTLAVVVNKSFALENPLFPVVWAGTFAFCFQIYADFSAYTDIARGSARLLGFKLQENFRHPYISTSPAEFWRRWHISLSTWFRDYVFIPLGGSRGTSGFVVRNLMITFLVSGLWHGASWNFVLWGGYHGLLLVLWRIVAPTRIGSSSAKPAVFVRWLTTFIAVNIGWMFFREQDFGFIGRYLTLLPWNANAAAWLTGGYFFMLTVLYSLPLWLHALVDERFSLPEKWQERRHSWSATLVQSAVGLLLMLGLLLLRSESASAFIYFQF